MEPERTGDPAPPAALTSSARTWWGDSQPLANLAHSAADVVKITFTTLRAYLRLDVPIVVFSLVLLALYAPLIPRNTDNPQLLAAYVNDEPFLTMALEATLVPPYGNPGAYFDPLNSASGNVPDHWAEMRYANITYYGGAMFQLAFPVYAMLRAASLPAFPTGPIVLRILTLFAGLLSLIVLYNIAKERGSRLVGIFAAAFVASDLNFIYYANYIHPDTLQMLFGLFAFILAVTHVKDGGRTSLIALGILCGIVQGTKSGGPWTVPMALLALWLGANSCSSGRSRRFGRLLGSRVLVLGAAALVGFFISTPYAFFDSYYRRMTAIAYSAVTNTAIHPGETLSLLTWGKALYEYIGPVAACLLALTIGRAAWLIWRRAWDPALTLAIVLALSQFLWYGVSGKLWHVPGYLLLSLGLTAVFAFETLLLAARKVVSVTARPAGHGVSAEKIGWGLTVVVVGTVLATGRWFVPTSWVVDQYTVSHSTVRAVNDWAIERGLRSNSVIVFDDLAYFDRERFPKARQHGGVLTWDAARARDPEYIILSSSLFASEWMKNLIATQRLARMDPNPYNVSLYQDLLATSVPGPTRVPGVVLEEIVRPTVSSSETSRVGEVANACSGAPLCDLGILDVGSELGLVAYLERRVRALAHAGDEPLVGPELWVFHVTRALDPENRPHALANETASEYKASDAFDGTAAAWVCKHAGAGARQCAIAYDFGSRDPRRVRGVQVKWIDGAATPQALEVEWSDDNVNWIAAAKVDVTRYPANAPDYRTDSFALPDRGRHRYWRLRPLEISRDTSFAVAEVTFRGPL